ncbi:hypothetical protein M422DRAFT_243880 [Sphaerobolus stellatus SS14]|nr:hypothetical protein M422DRAFT_243880 [Sphaerobolus stellatus SS14]
MTDRELHEALDKGRDCLSSTIRHCSGPTANIAMLNATLLGYTTLPLRIDLLMIIPSISCDILSFGEEESTEDTTEAVVFLLELWKDLWGYILTPNRCHTRITSCRSALPYPSAASSASQTLGIRRLLLPNNIRLFNRLQYLSRRSPIATA